MSLDLIQLRYLLMELQSRLVEDLELWRRYSSLAQSDSAKELAQEKVSALESQLQLAIQSLAQLESQQGTVNWKELALESAKAWE
jgi:Zn-dependent oligopeptidase